MGQGLFTNPGGRRFDLDHALPAGKGSRADSRYTRLSNCKHTRGTEPKRKLYLDRVWMARRGEHMEAAASLYLLYNSLSKSPGQANSVPTVASTLKTNPRATAETSLHTKFFKEKCNACIRPHFLPFKYMHRSLPCQKKASISLTFPLPSARETKPPKHCQMRDRKTILHLK